MKRLILVGTLLALVGCLPTDPNDYDGYPAPQMRSVGTAMGTSECVLSAHMGSIPVVVTDSGAACAKSGGTAKVLEWHWPRDRNGTCDVYMTNVRRVYGCYDMVPL